MKVRVLLFAAHRELLSQSRLELEVSETATPAGVFELLVEREPRLAQLKASTTFAVNREVVSPDFRLTGGDELALLQPVSGGSHD